MKSVQTCSKAVINLFIDSLERVANLDELFKYEISIAPSSSFYTEKINTCKSKFALTDCMIINDIVPRTIIDCSAILTNRSFVTQSH